MGFLDTFWKRGCVGAWCVTVTIVTTNNAEERARHALLRTLWIQWSRRTQELPPAGSTGYVSSSTLSPISQILACCLFLVEVTKHCPSKHVCSRSESARAPVRHGRNARVEHGGARGQRGGRLQLWYKAAAVWWVHVTLCHCVEQNHCLTAWCVFFPPWRWRWKTRPCLQWGCDCCGQRLLKRTETYNLDFK